MTFHEITVDDCEWARPLLESEGYQSCEYAFVNIYMWSRVFKNQIARFEDFPIVRGEGEEELFYLFPSGKGDKKAALDAILEDAALSGKRPVIHSISEQGMKQLQEWYPGRFTFDEPRGQADYVYLASDLADLPGKKYQKKRNHCSRFERQYPDWAFHSITPDSMNAIVAFNNEWASLYDNRGDAGIADEHRAIELAFSHFEDLCVQGGYITTGGRIVAFSFGSPLGKDIFVEHVEKALYDIPGAYNIINREMARHLAGQYTYINRENDLDEDGLRTAKLSYHPAFLVPKFTAEVQV